MHTSISTSLVQLAKAISDETRVSALQCITPSGSTPSQIARRLGIARGTAIHHLGILEDAGLVIGEWQKGRHVYTKPPGDIYIVRSEFGPPILPGAPVSNSEHP